MVGHVGLNLLDRLADRLGVGGVLSGVFETGRVGHDRETPSDRT